MRKRNKFSLSHHRLLSCRMGYLVPIGLTEVLPGDTIQHATTGLIRCAPLVSPVMARCDVRIHHFFVPMRLLWKNWEDFITGGPDGQNASPFPVMNLSNLVEGSLGDYFGLPTGVANMQVSALPFRAYALIYNEFYRDEDLIDPLSVSLEDGLDTVTNTQLQTCAWEKDYFTSARPWTQKGPAVTIPSYGGMADFSGTVNFQGTYAKLDVVNAGQYPGRVLLPKSQDFHYDDENAAYSTVSTTGIRKSTSADSGLAGIADVAGVSGPATATGKIDLSSAGGISVDDLRLALSLQRMQEARARYGSRYVEYLRYLGVISSDARLQRPEYLGGGRTPLQFSEVLQTAEGVNPVGEMRGHGIGALRSNRYRRFFEENGYVISLLSVRPKTVYGQMLPKTWLRRTKEDFFQPELQLIGQQEIYNKELKADHSNPDGVFGYQDRYNEYRYHESSISGEFRSTLNYWHMARIFEGDIALNADFVNCNPTDRIFAAPGTADNPNDTLYCFFHHSIQARRMLVPVANPGIK